MLLKRQSWCPKILLTAALATGSILVPHSLALAQAPAIAPKKSSVDQTAAEAQIRAALQNAVKRLNSGDFEGFMEYYAPAEELRRLRITKMLPMAIQGLKQDPNSLKLYFEKALKSKSWVFDESGAIVTIDLSNVGGDPVPETIPFVEPAVTKVSITGYGADLNTVFSKAIAALQKGNIEEIVTKLFPVGALREPGFDKKQSKIVAMYQAESALSAALLADLKSMQALKPKLADGGSTAEFTIPEGSPSVPPANAPNKTPARTVKLQKVDGNWRFYDSTTPARKTIAEQLTRPLPAIDTGADQQLRLERLGDAWRLMR